MIKQLQDKTATR